MFKIGKFNPKILLVTVLVVTLIIAGSLHVYAKNISSIAGLFSSKVITVTPVPVIATPTPYPTWTIAEKIIEAKSLLRDISLSVGDKNIDYTEARYMSVNGKIAETLKKFKEPEKQIALAVLDTLTGEIQVIKIIKRGSELIIPEDVTASSGAKWNIDILQRPNGILWNGWNTAYKINTPINKVVIANVYPNETDTRIPQIIKGKKSKTAYTTQRTIKYQLYVPYGPDLHSAELVESGRNYTDSIISQALQELKSSGVKSRAISGKLVADVFAHNPEFFSRIPLLEQTDLTEFSFDPQNTVERVQVIIGANKDQAFQSTCNSSSACGWLQFTPPTYNTIVKTYSSAKLIKDFKLGAADHLNSMKAAILLYDENLKGLISAHGQKIVEDPKLEEYLASSYNGAPRWVHKTLQASILGGIQDWVNALTSKTGGLKEETKGYMVKLRWLQQYQSSSVAVVSGQ